MPESKAAVSRIPDEVTGRVASHVRRVDDSGGKTDDTEVIVGTTVVEETQKTVVCEQDSSLAWLMSLYVVEIGVKAEVPCLKKEKIERKDKSQHYCRIFSIQLAKQNYFKTRCRSIYGHIFFFCNEEVRVTKRTVPIQVLEAES